MGFDPLCMALCDGTVQKPGFVVLRGDTLLASLGSHMTLNECAFASNKKQFAEIEKIRKRVYESSGNGSVYVVGEFDAMFVANITSLDLVLNQKATTCIRGEGVLLVGTTFALPYNGQTLVFYLEMQIPTTGEITGDNVWCCLSVAGGVTQ